VSPVEQSELGGDMAGIAKKSFESPDERRTPDKTEVQVVDLGSVKAARMTLQPGWRWSECIKSDALLSASNNCPPGNNTARQTTNGIQSGCVS
jgi:hypothetical protein